VPSACLEGFKDRFLLSASAFRDADFRCPSRCTGRLPHRHWQTRPGNATTISPDSVNLIELPTKFNEHLTKPAQPSPTTSVWNVRGDSRRPIRGPLGRERAEPAPARFPSRARVRRSKTVRDVLRAFQPQFSRKSRISLIMSSRAVGRGLGQRNVLALVCEVSDVSRASFRHAQDSVHWRTNLVAHVGEKLTLWPGWRLLAATNPRSAGPSPARRRSATSWCNSAFANAKAPPSAIQTVLPQSGRECSRFPLDVRRRPHVSCTA